MNKIHKKLPIMLCIATIIGLIPRLSYINFFENKLLFFLISGCITVVLIILITIICERKAETK